jgi:hypothetical protein
VRLRDKKNPNYKLITILQCMSWSYPGCSKLLRRRLHENIFRHLFEHDGPLYVRTGNETEWVALHQSIHRQEGRYFNIDVNAYGRECVISTVPLAGSREIQKSELDGMVFDLVAAVQSKNAITHSVGWSIKDTEKKSGQWEREGKLQPNRVGVTLTLRRRGTNFVEVTPMAPSRTLWKCFYTVPSDMLKKDALWLQFELLTIPPPPEKLWRQAWKGRDTG